MNYQTLIDAGLLAPTDKRDAAWMGLLNLGSQLVNRGAPRLTPTPPPLDMGKVMGAYQGSLQNAITHGLLKKKLEDEQQFKDMFNLQPANKALATSLVNPIAERYAATGILSSDDDPQSYFEQAKARGMPIALASTTMPSVMKGLPASFRGLQPYLQAGAKAGIGKEMYSLIGKLLGEQFKYRKPDYHKVKINGKESYLTTGQLQAAQNRGDKISPFTSPSVSVNLGGKADTGFQAYELKQSNLVQDEATTAYKALPKLNKISSLLDEAQSHGWKTGTGETLKMDAQKLMQTFGWTSETTNKALAKKELFVAETIKLILPLVKDLGVNPTDKDLEFVKLGAPELTKTLEGNILILKGLIVGAKRSVARAKFDRDFMARNVNLLKTNPIQYRIKRTQERHKFLTTDPIFKPFPRPPIGSGIKSTLPSYLLKN